MSYRLLIIYGNIHSEENEFGINHAPILQRVELRWEAETST